MLIPSCLPPLPPLYSLPLSSRFLLPLALDSPLFLRAARILLRILPDLLPVARIRHVLKSLWAGSVGASAGADEASCSRTAYAWEQNLSWLCELGLGDFSSGHTGSNFYAPRRPVNLRIRLRSSTGASGRQRWEARPMSLLTEPWCHTSELAASLLGNRRQRSNG